jgi:IclR family transcriptional regulator, mhp operon transcriptional activator
MVMSRMTTDPLRGATRTIAVIKALNLLGVASVSEIARTANISRQAVYRILGALVVEGLAAQETYGERYKLTLGIRALSEGFKDEDWVRDIAAPVVDDLQQQIVWPTNFATFNGRSMVIRHTSRPKSPLVIDRASVGLAVPLLETAMGLAYLAWSNPSDVAEILRALKADEAPGWEIAKDDHAIAQLLETTRNRGYATRPGNFMPETRSMAVPIHHLGRTIGAIAFTYFKSSCGEGEAVRRYLPTLLASQNHLHLLLGDADSKLSPRKEGDPRPAVDPHAA